MRRSVGVMVVVATLVFSGGATAAAPPTAVPASTIKLAKASGFVHSAQEWLQNGSVIETFTKGSARVKVLGAPGDSVSIEPTVTAKGRSNVAVTLHAPIEKSQQAAVPLTAISSVIALGMDPKAAHEQFDGFDSPEALAAEAAALQTASLEPMPLPRAT
jgi:hypothetical protein